MPKKKIDKIDKLAKELKLNDKEKRSYVKLARKLKPKKVNDRISQKTRAVTHFENGLKRIKKFKLDDNMNAQIPLREGESRDLHFDSVEAFEAYKENEIKTVENKIEYEKNDKKHFETIKKFKEALR